MKPNKRIFNAEFASIRNIMTSKMDMIKNIELLFPFLFTNRPVSHSARHQRPARERHIMRIASWENVDNQAPHNTNFTQ